MDGNTTTKLWELLELPTCYAIYEPGLKGYTYDCGMIINPDLAQIQVLPQDYILVIQAHEEHHLLHHDPEDDLYVLAVVFDDDVIVKATCACKV